MFRKDEVVAPEEVEGGEKDIRNESLSSGCD